MSRTQKPISKKMRVLITGISGFVGTHLAQHLSQQGELVVGFDKAPPKNRDIHSYEGDIANLTEIKHALNDFEPQIVFHLAGILKASQPEAFHQVNVLGTNMLMDAVRERNKKPIVLLASSSAIYGRGYGGRPITERFRPRPETPYATSKLEAEKLARSYFKSDGVPIVIARAFNLLGPGQPPTLACSAFARQIALVEKSGASDTIVTGNLSARRDYTDVRDVVRAYVQLAQRGRPGSVYNICSGQAVATRECLDILVQMAGVPLRVIVDPDRLQATDIPIQVGSAERLHRLTGWQPRISLRQSLANLLAYWRDEVA